MTAATAAPVIDVTAEAEDAVLKPCACSFVHIEGEDERCIQTTKRTFAPGHDAKLKSRLIDAGFRGLAVSRVSADGTAQLISVAEAAGEHGFGYQVTDGIVRAQRKASEKATRKAEREAVREANRATREAAKAERGQARAAKRASQIVQGKVGRWVVTGVVKKGDLHYTTKKGVDKVAKKGTWTLVDDAA